MRGASIELDFRYLDIDGQRVSGATAMAIAALLAVIGAWVRSDSRDATASDQRFGSVPRQ